MALLTVSCCWSDVQPNKPPNSRSIRDFAWKMADGRLLFLALAHPLYALTRKGAQFQWTAECEVAFETLFKVQVTNSTNIIIPRF